MKKKDEVRVCWRRDLVDVKMRFSTSFIFSCFLKKKEKHVWRKIHWRSCVKPGRYIYFPSKIETSCPFTPKQNPAATHSHLDSPAHCTVSGEEAAVQEVVWRIDTHFDFLGGLKKWSRLGYGNEDCTFTHSLSNLCSSFPASSPRQAGGGQLVSYTRSEDANSKKMKLATECYFIKMSSYM
ncbi:uncharacterized protein LOC111400565 [Olea europaea var. sylvestris]|uniref:uncharacterized protein LOC111400565 n=1 Tax=Olea europaea var. sylvestris TaxID=158386 RepID=UPI000C1CE5B9|nr:uncharacterized protein LOC111400565 [Olea europaea var. sylvestris]